MKVIQVWKSRKWASAAIFKDGRRFRCLRRRSHSRCHQHFRWAFRYSVTVLFRLLLSVKLEVFCGVRSWFEGSALHVKYLVEQTMVTTHKHTQSKTINDDDDCLARAMHSENCTIPELFSTANEVNMPTAGSWKLGHLMNDQLTCAWLSIRAGVAIFTCTGVAALRSVAANGVVTANWRVLTTFVDI